MSQLPAALRLPARNLPAGRAVAELREPREESSPIPSIELLQGMTLSAFRDSDLVVVVRCAVLGEEVVWAADGTIPTAKGFDDQGRVVYHGEELLLLLALASDPESLRGYHAMRKAMGRVEVVSLTHEEPAAVEPEKTLNPESPKKGNAA